jgi:hypothetical protein
MSPGTLGGISLGYLTVRVASLHLGSKEFRISIYGVYQFTMEY